ncbi:MAG TPA: class I SAM-dependent methyltransferase [Candidatus Limnocylindrales bacterium]|nr:class I SAM-dependent methyltransferase [Candidatus Limnocylindrales bacterium]
MCGGAALYLDPLAEEEFDVLHAATGPGSLLGSLDALAFGAAYPREVQPFGQCSLALLRLAAAGLRVKPGDHLVDLGCGRGGPGLWLARHCGARLTGVDFSRVALAAASGWAARMSLSHPVRFRHGLLTGCGLADACADAVICIDAALLAAQRGQVLAEIGRLLRPGGRALITVAQTTAAIEATHPRAVANWRPLVEQARLTLRRIVDLPMVTSVWTRLHGLWLDNAIHLRHVLGADVAATLLGQASLPRKLFTGHRELALVLGKP